MINSKWSRWVKASLAVHFDSKRQNKHLHVEGFPRQTAELSEWLELRVDGPFVQEWGRDNFQLDVEVNVACIYVPGDNRYGLEELTGIASAAFTYVIPVNRIGPSIDPENDGSLLGCLTLIPGKRERVVISNFGKIRPDTDMYQATVEGHYRMFLDP